MNNNSINQIPSSSGEQFKRELEDLSKPELWNGYLIVENGTLKQTNVLVSIWERIKSSVGFSNKVDNVEEKVFEYIIDHEKEINSETDIKLVIALAKKAGLNKNAGGSRELQNLVNVLSHKVFKHVPLLPSLQNMSELEELNLGEKLQDLLKRVKVRDDDYSKLINNAYKATYPLKNKETIETEKKIEIDSAEKGEQSQGQDDNASLQEKDSPIEENIQEPTIPNQSKTEEEKQPITYFGRIEDIHTNEDFKVKDDDPDDSNATSYHDSGQNESSMDNEQPKPQEIIKDEIIKPGPITLLNIPNNATPNVRGEKPSKPITSDTEIPDYVEEGTSEHADVSSDNKEVTKDEAISTEKEVVSKENDIISTEQDDAREINEDVSKEDEVVVSKEDEVVSSENEVITTEQDEAIPTENEVISSEEDEVISSEEDEAISSEQEEAISTENEPTENEVISAKQDEVVSAELKEGVSTELVSNNTDAIQAQAEIVEEETPEINAAIQPADMFVAETDQPFVKTEVDGNSKVTQTDINTVQTYEDLIEQLKNSSEYSIDPLGRKPAAIAYEKLMGIPFKRDEVNPLEYNLYAILRAVQKDNINKFDKLLSFLSDDPSNQFSLLANAYQLSKTLKLDNFQTHILGLIRNIQPENVADINLDKLKWDIKKERLALSYEYFKDTTGKSFLGTSFDKNEAFKADIVDEWIFDIFTAVEDKDVDGLKTLLQHVSFGDYQNTKRVLMYANMMHPERGITDPGDREHANIKTLLLDAQDKNNARLEKKSPTDIYDRYDKDNDTKFAAYLKKQETDEKISRQHNTLLMVAAASLLGFIAPIQSHLQPKQLWEGVEQEQEPLDLGFSPARPLELSDTPWNTNTNTNQSPVPQLRLSDEPFWNTNQSPVPQLRLSDKEHWNTNQSPVPLLRIADRPYLANGQNRAYLGTYQNTNPAPSLNEHTIKNLAVVTGAGVALLGTIANWAFGFFYPDSAVERVNEEDNMPNMKGQDSYKLASDELGINDFAREPIVRVKNEGEDVSENQIRNLLQTSTEKGMQAIDALFQTMQLTEIALAKKMLAEAIETKPLAQILSYVLNNLSMYDATREILLANINSKAADKVYSNDIFNTIKGMIASPSLINKQMGMDLVEELAKTHANDPEFVKLLLEYGVELSDTNTADGKYLSVSITNIIMHDKDVLKIFKESLKHVPQWKQALLIAKSAVISNPNTVLDMIKAIESMRQENKPKLNAIVEQSALFNRELFNELSNTAARLQDKEATTYKNLFLLTNSMKSTEESMVFARPLSTQIVAGVISILGDPQRIEEAQNEFIGLAQINLAEALETLETLHQQASLNQNQMTALISKKFVQSLNTQQDINELKKYMNMNTPFNQMVLESITQHCSEDVTKALIDIGQLKVGDLGFTKYVAINDVINGPEFDANENKISDEDRSKMGLQVYNRLSSDLVLDQLEKRLRFDEEGAPSVAKGDYPTTLLHEKMIEDMLAKSAPENILYSIQTANPESRGFEGSISMLRTSLLKTNPELLVPMASHFIVQMGDVSNPEKARRAEKELNRILSTKPYENLGNTVEERQKAFAQNALKHIQESGELNSDEVVQSLTNTMKIIPDSTFVKIFHAAAVQSDIMHDSDA
ncbi:MAG TPA: hypothetical protein VGP47_04160, partial [Parachlamydiaceae bacterium]|nr:hypothetical protein [Parachlamydiaceae bacterium]